ncbi:MULTISPECIES: ABC transporter ATP-binding protein [unclassified Streptomyces]|uniref:ABC transporter ATP-binding protein n=1 Tax=unclassified Streptomyces TaxID=2593676 RepID=UPI0022545F73|nr:MULTISPECIES: ABC transporter ATP-binding protein [unclassified Streptomyces]MCX4529123.1 ABC transporter ATP-binding protein [Streptomyces sp. NBC_01551]MCX4540194.1 ABC transporter ATP-binding protein [Streptomyces sp. NBC_01565]
MPGGRYVEAVTDATFDLAPGECLALVGESGCGKSVLASALLGLLPDNAETSGTAHLAPPDPGGAEPGGADLGSTRPGGAHLGAARLGVDGPGAGRLGSGAFGVDGTGRSGLELLAADERTLARVVRGRRIGLVPQSPAAHLTPVRTIRSHLEETVRELTPTPKAGLRAAAEAAARRAAFPESHLDRHPHELSGGLAQRAATALALIGDAPLLLADEPTTGLDRDLVHRTVDELRAHTREAGRALLMITHDLAAAHRIADTVAVMYAGRIVEIAAAGAFFGEPGPRHPYARGLLDALPERAFTPIPGAPPELGDLPRGCAFAARCPRADAVCRAGRPPLTEGVACHHA